MSARSSTVGEIARWDQRRHDADRARELVEQALDYESDLRRLHGPDRLLAAAQVYATLASR